MAGSVRVMLGQLAPRTHDVEANVATACRLIAEHSDTQLAVFPELFLQAYALQDLDPLDVDALTGPLLPLFECARENRTAVIVGTAERMDDTMANTALCIDELGDLIARYRKVHLFDGERGRFVSGDEYVVVVLAGVAVGPLVCYDLEFPEGARALAGAGAELLVTISANMDPYAEDHALFLRTRALENRLPHVYVNCVGQEGRLRFCGRSTVADSFGRTLLELPAYRPAVRFADVPLGAPVGDVAPDYLAERRPDVPARAVRHSALQSKETS